MTKQSELIRDWLDESRRAASLVVDTDARLQKPMPCREELRFIARGDTADPDPRGAIDEGKQQG